MTNSIKLIVARVEGLNNYQNKSRYLYKFDVSFRQ